MSGFHVAPQPVFQPEHLHMIRFSTRAWLPLVLILVIGLTGCQDSLVEPTPEVLDGNTPMTQAEFDKQLAENGVVVLEPKDYAAYGGVFSDSDARKSNCDQRSSGDIEYEVCTSVSQIIIDNVDFFRVTIDAEISSPPEVICNPFPQSGCTIDVVPVRVTSTTIRGDGVVLQNGETDQNGILATTDFVAVYPQADDFTFNHESNFETVDIPLIDDMVSVTLNP